MLVYMQNYTVINKCTITVIEMKTTFSSKKEWEPIMKSILSLREWVKFDLATIIKDLIIWWALAI